MLINFGGAKMLNSKTFYKIISVIIALVLWAYVIQVVNPTKTQTFPDIPVQLLNEDSLTTKGEALSGDDNYTVTIKLKGKRADLSKVSAADIVANADLYGFGIGDNSIPVTVSVPDGITVVDVKSPKINVVIEELVEVAKQVKINFVGDKEEGEEPGQISLDPVEVTVSGAKSEVSLVNYVKADVNIGKLETTSTAIDAKAVAVGSNGEEIPNVRLSSSYISVNAMLCTVKTVSLEVATTGSVAEGYQMADINAPSTVRIKGTSDSIKSVSTLTSNVINLSGMNTSATVNLNVPLPQGVEFANGYETLSAYITIKPIVTTQFVYTVDELTIEGDSSGNTVTILPVDITLSVSGIASVINDLAKEDFELYFVLDADTLAAGAAQIGVRTDKQLSSITTEPQWVQFTLNKTE